MSAYLVDPRTIDYLVSWAKAHQYGNRALGVRRTSNEKTSPALLAEFVEWSNFGGGSQHYGRFQVMHVPANVLGKLLLDENFRSINSRYPDTVDNPENAPGPIDQTRILDYRHTGVGDTLRPAWVVSSCDCLEYQSCETENYRETWAYALTQAIRESAINALIGEDAPWGVTQKDLVKSLVA